MHRFAKKVAVLFVAAALMLGGLAGCGLFAPHSAQDVLMRYANYADRGNFAAEGKIDIAFTVLKQEIPLNMNVDAQVRGEALHATVKSKMLGMDVASEYYLQKDGDDFVLYSSAGEGEDAVWTKSTLGGKSKDTNNKASASDSKSGGEGDLLSTIDTLLFAQKVLEETEYTETDNGYVLTVPGSALLDAIDSSEEAKKLVKDVEQKTLKDVLEDATLVLEFDKDCKLTHLTLSVDIDSLAGNEDKADNKDDDSLKNLFEFDASCKLDADFSISGYGSVQEDTVTVPDKVKEKATDIDELTEDVGNLFDFSNLGQSDQKAA